MAKKTKTWKIGEYARGGIITAEVNDKKCTIIGKEWDFSQGSRRSSNQKNAKEFTRLELTVGKDEPVDSQLDEFLNDLTTSYYADQVLEWIRKECKYLVYH